MRGFKLRMVLLNALVLVLVAAMLMPLLYMITMSFRTATEIAQAPLGVPERFAWENYLRAFGGMNYVRAVLNSVFITISVTGLTALLGSMAAFPLARNTSRLARIFVLLVALGLATPNFVTITPIYVIFRDLGLLDTYLGIILAFSALNLPLAVFFYVGFIGAIPQDLVDAAKLDNCSDWQVFWYVIRPLLVPATATLSLFVMLMVWNDFTYPLLLLTDKDKFTVTISVYRFVGNTNIQPDMLFPAAVLGSLPLLVLFVIFQRRIVAGVTAGAVK
ncbi:carbohydrate ABC transporter permease [Epibacterium ulvae]|uniref:Carbohydrate ABC transporter membrane protein 2, CUT1 family n=1 Tax=Epibacterium ulvae TaxID=1156985 RepID=A0A1G5QF81_9RHOB|nr:carbohydrate ABC transporter permease [Epibacterium ulvae]SCZ60454.1 carbohydrate ABC transporter membrane protein 2, CUT1 family [Epibacterium ulvae]